MPRLRDLLFGRRQPAPAVNAKTRAVISPKRKRFISQLKARKHRQLNSRIGRSIAKRHARTTDMFRVNPVRVSLPLARLDDELGLSRPWWTPVEVTRDELEPRAEENGPRVVSQVDTPIRLLDGRQVIQRRRVLLMPDGKRIKEFLAVEDAKTYSFNQIDISLLPLFGAEDVDPAEDLLVCEGIQAAQAARQAGHSAVATTTGALYTPSYSSLKPISAVRRIYLWPDNDSVGVAHMRRTAERLKKLGAPEVRFLRWRSGPRKGDAADFFKLGSDLQQLKETSVEWRSDQTENSVGVVRVDLPKAPIKLRLPNGELPGEGE